MHRLVMLMPPSLVAWALLAPAAFAQRGGGYPVGSGRDQREDNDDEVVESFNAGLTFFVLALVALAIAVLVVRRRRRKRARADRERQIARAARMAVRDDPAFAPAAVKSAATALYIEMLRAWSERDEGALERGLGPELLADWRRRLARFERRGWTSEHTIVEGPRVGYVGLVNNDGIDEDRVTVAISATVNRTVRTAEGRTLYGEGADHGGDVEVSEYWTLARDGDGWRVVSIDDDRTSPYHLSAPIVPLPAADGTSTSA
jgi:predicted lipid-binding transport protein (Tim44 family)